MHKVAAHVSEHAAAAGGWQEHWRGNDLADQYAKMARPRILGPDVAWIRWQRKRSKHIELALGTVPVHPWNVLRELRRMPRDPGAGRGPSPTLGHTPE